MTLNLVPSSAFITIGMVKEPALAPDAPRMTSRLKKSSGLVTPEFSHTEQ